MQSRPTFSPFEVEGKLLKDSPLEETRQYGEHQQLGVHQKVRIMFNPSGGTLAFNLRWAKATASASLHPKPRLLVSGR